MTPEERRLWFDFLKDYPIKIYKQRIIDNYIVDFFCAQARLVIEIDGSQHFFEDGLRQDEIRTETLEKHGLQVLRFSNLDVRRNFRGVCEAIEEAINNASSRV